MRTPKLDKLGRVVIPMDYRKELQINVGDPLTITMENGAVIIRPAKSVCRLCFASIEAGKKIPLCDKCIAEVNSSISTC